MVRHLSTWVFWIIMVGVLVAMLVLAYDDAAQTGEDPNIVGALAGWVALVAFSGLIMWLRNLIMRGTVKLLERISDRLDD